MLQWGVAQIAFHMLQTGGPFPLEILELETHHETVLHKPCN